ncbi:hypothetical protein LOAG_13589 [Loa loa]|uniref:Uncharacterized protein n=1 Tax=Loa loa TaxID=7209 RepID=A0A1S0TJN6_LOALO|nr:hypothetical protein LOAG_13589 [Loa loa]EFO14927.1 hypothetical protein LOAG_13589 [Loa loa]
MGSLWHCPLCRYNDMIIHGVDTETSLFYTVHCPFPSNGYWKSLFLATFNMSSCRWRSIEQRGKILNVDCTEFLKSRIHFWPRFDEAQREVGSYNSIKVVWIDDL